MRKLLTCKHLLPFQTRAQPSSWLALFVLTLSLTAVWNRAQAATPQTAPPQLKNLLTQIDAAANQHDVKAVMQFYGENFSHSDGLSRQSMEKALTQLWQRYPNLKYQTQLQSWKSEGNALVAETVTNITGVQSRDSRNQLLRATIRSRQRYENERIARQEILSERSQLSAGAKPPTVEVKLPQQVNTGQQYNFDAIVQEPLGDDYLLGAAIEEPIQANKYFTTTPVDLELLAAGGLFKLGRAPALADDRWVSALVIRGDGMTVVTQRLQVVGQNRPISQEPRAKSQDN
jgi:ketosteroid isomerase-like protein